MTKPPTKFSDTYLYKLHLLKHILDKAFDQALRAHTSTTLSQFMVLLTIAENKSINQRAIAGILNISPAAIARQVSLADNLGLIIVKHPKGNIHMLELSPTGHEVIDRGIEALQKYVFKIFENSDANSSLMGHIDMLLTSTKGVLYEQRLEVKFNQ